MSSTLPQGSFSNGPPSARSFSARLKNAWELEFANFRWSLFLCSLFARLVPEGRATLFRASLIRAIGATVGAQTRFLGMPKIQCLSVGPLGPKLRIGPDSTIGARVILELGEVLTIGERVTISDGVVILTTTHELGPKEHRAGPIVKSPVAVGSDVSIGAHSIILPGSVIGDGARVLANSVVNAKVTAGATVGGIPARPIRAA